MTAKLIIDNLPNFLGHAALYEVDPPMEDYNGNRHGRIIVSTARPMGVVETFAFPAGDDNEVSDWMELPCSQKGVASHHQILAEAGYELCK